MVDTPDVQDQVDTPDIQELTDLASFLSALDTSTCSRSVLHNLRAFLCLESTCIIIYRDNHQFICIC